MQQYKTNTTVKISGGLVGLSADQAKTRVHNLKSLGGGVFEVQSPITLKAGEPVSLASVDKAMAPKLDAVDAAPAPDENLESTPEQGDKKGKKGKKGK